MTAPEGGFYSAEDADSERVEGKFYVWNIGEIQRVLDPAEAALVTRVFNLKPEGNFNEEATGRLTGSNIPHWNKSLAEVAADLGTTVDDLENALSMHESSCFQARGTARASPTGRQILTDWNGLMIAALAKAAQDLEQRGVLGRRRAGLRISCLP